MKTDTTGSTPEKTARRSRLVDFLFVGAGVAPLALMLGGQTEIAILLLVPLLLAACLCGAWEQVATAPEQTAGGDDLTERRSGKRSAAAGVNLRNQLKR